MRSILPEQEKQQSSLSKRTALSINQISAKFERVLALIIPKQPLALFGREQSNGPAPQKEGKGQQKTAHVGG